MEHYRAYRNPLLILLVGPSLVFAFERRFPQRGMSRRILSGVLATNLDAPAIRRTLANVGGQIDFRFIALSNMDLTLSVGGAAAFDFPRRPGDLAPL